MASTPLIAFSSLEAPAQGVMVLLAGDGAILPASISEALKNQIARAATAAKFKGKLLSTLEVLAPDEPGVDKVLVLGTKGEAELTEEDWLKLGGVAMAGIKGAENILIRAEIDEPVSGANVAAMALGVLLRAYEFDRYKSKKTDDADVEAGSGKTATISFASADADTARTAFEAIDSVGAGVVLARDLVNEPANILTTVEYTRRIEALRHYGLEVEVLDEVKMRELKMFALLGVAQGSPMPPRMVIMRWNGGPEGEAPVAFVGKGVVFDTGGVSIKPAAGMDEMKGDMGGSAAVVGLMRALAGRKAKVNAVGVVGLVENVVDGNAQRPGDIVTAMSGTTIEVLNTDAEGRLVLADALWYTQERFKPKFMVNLATLTGAIIVALGNHYAGLFANDDELAERLYEAGTVTGEKVWRMPLGKEYDKMIEGKFADIRNIGGGRAAGSITAAQFLQRFVNKVPWAHLDVAGTAMSSPSSEYNQSWGSGFGVRLLNRLVADHYETR
ncbi:leucyl aminopeptidase [Aureimonas fodinaquatilis]|uniref:Probable cytosol aminopeptidase n=1 Tax=Aureimonas fodinaquatilis TaxID=2565783 RepID=A0A5B0DV53_9HYPH|nr:leucyl aminopeptidase [Aureimonas fodinaquatilis]KAA0970218.1 leucyl aminopeptidase [Aureimonas fodinaquatilis]